ncbi:hypothetical protein IFT63_04210 [Stenotrophomonas sp. CFBP 13724]|uniref:hypothetical protein n=1 Tax=Stenotrophomonas sp. CFBP 13724 TaxID=2775298 RepID=UPI00177F903B|nr:hypothetical protein [Stenotrophomonas sp. CFBP 13724]MBD8642790.1 hypothetical protein [Stenotrophomonas sp. CFBP 13724]
MQSLSTHTTPAAALAVPAKIRMAAHAASHQANDTPFRLDDVANTPSGPHSQLEALPQEMLAEIAKYLPSQALFALSDTSGRMGRRVDEIAVRTLMTELQAVHDHLSERLNSVGNGDSELRRLLGLNLVHELGSQDTRGVAAIKDVHRRHAEAESRITQVTENQRIWMKEYLHRIEQMMAENGHSLVTSRDA